MGFCVLHGRFSGKKCEECLEESVCDAGYKPVKQKPTIVRRGTKPSPMGGVNVPLRLRRRHEEIHGEAKIGWND